MMKTVLSLLMLVALIGCANSLYSQGTEAFHKQNYATAELLYKQSIRNGEDVSESWNNLGVIYQRNGRFDWAKQAYTMAARYGNTTAQQNLISLNAPVPAADLANTQNNRSSDGTEGMAYLLGGIVNARQQNSSGPVVIYDSPSRPAPNPYMMQMPKSRSYNCSNTGPGTSTCNEQ